MPLPQADGLTVKQRMWLRFYLGEANFNATEAARLAGYKDPNQSGPDNTVKDGIRQAIQKAMRERAMPEEEVIARTSDIARSSADDILEFVDDVRTPFLDLRKAKKRGMLHTIKDISFTPNGLKIERYNALDALKTLAQIYQMFGEAKINAQVEEINVLIAALPPEFAREVSARLAATLQPGGATPSLDAGRADPDGAFIDSGQGREVDPAGSE